MLGALCPVDRPVRVPQDFGQLGSLASIIKGLLTSFKDSRTMASLLGNLTYAGLQTILSSQATLGNVGATTANLYSIASGQPAAAPPDVALFQMGIQQVPLAIATQGTGCCTLPVLLFTRTGSVTVWYNPNTTVVMGDILVQYVHSICR